MIPGLRQGEKELSFYPNAIKPWLCLPLILLTCSHLEELSLPVASAAFRGGLSQSGECLCNYYISLASRTIMHAAVMWISQGDKTAHIAGAQNGVKV